MGTVSIFVLLCKVVYLVNLCSSAVIDFEKEREDLCAMAGIKDRKCTESENILLKEGVKRKQEIENERDLRKQAEDQKNEYFNRTVKAEEQKEQCSRPLRIISVRSKMESLVKKIYPLGINQKTNETIYGKPSSPTCDAIQEMLSSQNERFMNDPYIQDFRDTVKEYGISTKSFMKFIRWLYDQFSDKAAHEMSRYSPPLPEYNDTKGIEEMLKCVEIDKDIPAIIAIQIVLKPFDLPSGEVMQ